MNYYYEKEEFENDLGTFFFFLRIFVCVLFACLIMLYADETYAAESELPQEQYATISEAYDKLLADGKITENFKHCVVLKVEKFYDLGYSDLNFDTGVYFFFFNSNMYRYNEKDNMICKYWSVSNSNYYMDRYNCYAFLDKDNYLDCSSAFGFNGGISLDYAKILDCSSDIVYARDTTKVFFQCPPVPPVVNPNMTELERTQHKIQQQIVPIIQPKMTKTLDYLLPLGIGLLACLISLVILPKVLRKFLN